MFAMAGTNALSNGWFGHVFLSGQHVGRISGKSYMFKIFKIS